MTTTPENPDRRTALRRVMGVGAVSVGLPLVARVLGEGGPSLIGRAEAAANPGVGPNKGDLVYIPSTAAITTTVAEWMDPKFPIGPYRIAAAKAAVEKAPPTAARCEVKQYNFPSGSLRLLTYKKGGPVMHLITFETEIYVLQGSAMLEPLKGHPGKPIKISAGDALFMPSGHITSAKASEDLVLLTALVNSTVRDAKKSIVTAKQAQVSESAEWMDGDKEMTARKPEELKKAPKNAIRTTVHRYAFDGNSIRVANLKKGDGRTATFNNNRVDVLIYIAKGHLRRKEGDQILDLKPGDVVREKRGNSGYWEVPEDSVFIATDAPMNPGLGSPTDV